MGGQAIHFRNRRGSSLVKTRAVDFSESMLGSILILKHELSLTREDCRSWPGRSYNSHTLSLTIHSSVFLFSRTRWYTAHCRLSDTLSLEQTDLRKHPLLGHHLLHDLAIDAKVLHAHHPETTSPCIAYFLLRRSDVSHYKQRN